MRSRRSARFLFEGASSLRAGLGGRFLPASAFAGRFFAYGLGLSGLGLSALATLRLSALTTFMTQKYRRNLAQVQAPTCSKFPEFEVRQ